MLFHISGPKGLILPRTKPTSNYKRSKRRDKRCDIWAKLMRHFLEQHNAKHFHYLNWTVVHRLPLLVSIRSLSWFVQIKGARSMGVSMGKAKRKVGFFLNVFLHNLPIQLRTCLWFSHVREIVFGSLLCFSLKDRITGVLKLIFHHYSFTSKTPDHARITPALSRTYNEKQRIILGQPDLNSWV